MTDRPDLAILISDLGGGGAERVAVTLANRLYAAGKRVDVLLMTHAGVLLPLLNPGVRVIDLKATKVRWVPVRLAGYLRQRRPRAILAFMWPLTVAAVVGRALARSDARLVVADHAVLSLQYSTPRARASLRLSTRLAYPRADARVMVSDAAADDLAALSGLARSSIEVIRNPLTLPQLLLSRDPKIDALWTGSGRRILTVGRMTDEKRHADLVAAVASLVDRGIQTQLMILGEGPLRTSLAEQARKLGIADQVHLPGFRTDPWPFYASADLFALASAHEGYGLVLVEALHAGLPVVSSDCPGGPREILVEGRWGRLVPVARPDLLADALAATLDDRPDRAAQQGRAEVLSGRGSIDLYAGLLFGPKDQGPR